MPIPFITRAANIECSTGKSSDHFSSMMFRIGLQLAETKNDLFIRFLQKKQKILEIGLGSGWVACSLMRAGYKHIESVDVVNMSMYTDIQPTLYDGLHLPFKKKSFDTALLLHVLHHCSNQLQVLQEAKRVSDQIVIIEDVYTNPVEKKFVAMSDSLCNFEFYHHHYRTKESWDKEFVKGGWEIVHRDEWKVTFPKTALFTRHYLCVIRKKTS